ncbi:MAG: low molecular weight phosphatase family protein [Oscillospiraceae bacterium]|nr:low molecular weight phosphatase family protein [Candidatus Equicaccousia limihippi]
MVLFVCTGNTCRSPMAAAIYSSLGFGESDSAGLCANLESASENAVLCMKEKGIDISSHVSKPLTLPLLKSADKVCVMTEYHKSVIKNAGYEGEITVLDCPDPFGGDLDRYRAARDYLYKVISAKKEEGIL